LGDEPIYPSSVFFNFSYNSGPTHSLAYAHHSMQEFMSLKIVSPHLLHCTLTSEEKTSTSSPQRGHFLIVSVGVRRRAVPGQLLNNVVPFLMVIFTFSIFDFSKAS
jgi:hypothetical protein